MHPETKRINFVYLSKFLLAFAYGIFLLMPLYINSLGGNEVFSGKLLMVLGLATFAFIYFTKVTMRPSNVNLMGVVGALLFAVGAFCFSCDMHLSNRLFLYVTIIGCGWGMCWNIAAYCLYCLLGEKNRVKEFSYLAAALILGQGIAPIIVKNLGVKIDFHSGFIAASIIALFSAGSFALIKLEALEIANAESNHTKGVSFLTIIKTNAKYPFAMLFLGSCAFTVMMNFQSTYAKVTGLNFAVFYFCFTATVVSSRLFISGYLTRFDRWKALIFFELIFLLGTILFSFVVISPMFYPIASILFGTGYGLTYPLLQELTVHSTKKQFHKDAISYFYIVYFVAGYGFPYIAGKIIVYAGYQKILFVLALIILLEFLLSVTFFLKTRVPAKKI